MSKKTIKFTEEEIKSINDLRIEVSGVFAQLGQLSIERVKRLKELDANLDFLMSKHAELEDVEKTLFKELNDKYGDGNYNPDTGEFTPIDTQKPQPTT